MCNVYTCFLVSCFMLVAFRAWLLSCWLGSVVGCVTGTCTLIYIYERLTVAKNKKKLA